MIKLLMIFLITTNLWAATVWTAQPERYNTYQNKKALVRVLVTSIDSVPADWVKLDGEYIKEVSSGGAVRYIKAPEKDQCEAQFVCHQQFGWVVKITPETVNKCPSIKILNGQIIRFDSVKVGGECPTYLK